MTTSPIDNQQLALTFTELLAARDYATAYDLTAQEYRWQITLAELQAAFEEIVPLDWGDIGPLEIGQTLTDWPGKQPADLGWVYVSIGGDIYSEAITVIITLENGHPKIREIEFGRP